MRGTGALADRCGVRGCALLRPGSWCGFGISDDGNGNYALAYLGGSILGTFFVTIDAGKAVEIGKRSFCPVHGSWRMFSQPSGFTRFELDETTLGTTLRSWSHVGHD